MTATAIDGKAFAAALRAYLATHVAMLRADHDITPGLVVVLVGDDPASEVYVRNKARQAGECGMRSFETRLGAATTQSELLAVVQRLNADPAVHGILVQLPLPAHIDANAMLAAIDPAKDVDGFHLSNVGQLSIGQKSIVPCTPLGCLMLLRQIHRGGLAGLHAVIVGRSNIVGKPMAQLLLREDCTVTIAHSRTRDLSRIIGGADILVAAIGKPEMIRGDWIKPGATIIDVGISRVTRDGKTRLVGDVNFAEAAEIAGAITPVPGGVGPMTIACLLLNTTTACCRAHRLPEPAGLAELGL